MTLLEAIQARHSVRSYTDQKIQGNTQEALQSAIDSYNQESGLHIQLCLDEPTAFSGGLARYGKFENVQNYIALVGGKGAKLEETCGYYGQKLVLLAQQLGLNTCWVALTFRKGKSKKRLQIAPGQKLLMVISLGCGTTQGISRKTKPVEALCQADQPLPDWFRAAMNAVQLAPTARNQQAFTFTLKGNAVAASPGSGFYSKTDLGIAKCHFEIGAADADWHWTDQ